MLENVQNLRDQIESISLTNKEEAEQFRLQFLSKKGAIQDLFKEFRNVPAEQKKAFGAALNELKQLAEGKHKEALEGFESTAATGVNGDITRPGLHKPELLIFDEPFTGFDPINTNLIKKEIKRLNKEGATVIFSTHRMESVEEICDYIGLINQGEVMVEGPLLDIRRHYMNGTYAFTTKTEQTFAGLNVLSRDHQHTGYTTTIKSDQYPSGIIQELASSNELLGFEEVLPSVSDVFIDIVQNGPKPKDS